MGKKNHSRRRRRPTSGANGNRKVRLQRPPHSHSPTGARAPGGNRRARTLADACPMPWVLLREEVTPAERASDGSTTVAFEVFAEHACFAVFDAEGKLGEVIELIGPEGLGDEDERLLQMFMLRRRAVGDPLFSNLPPQADEPSPPVPNPPRRGQHEMRRYVYRHFPPAPDGSRMVMCGDQDADRWVFAVDADGVRFDATWLPVGGPDPALLEVQTRFFQKRLAAGDPTVVANTVRGGRS